MVQIDLPQDKIDLKKSSLIEVNVEKNDVNCSFDNFLLNMKGLLEKHAPFRKVSKYQLKLKAKPVKSSLFKKYIRLKDPVEKNDTHNEYKYYRNFLSTVIKKSKKKYYNEFFKNKMNNTKKILGKE